MKEETPLDYLLQAVVYIILLVVILFVLPKLGVWVYNVLTEVIRCLS